MDIIFVLNGRITASTEYGDVVIRQAAYALRSCTENSSTNAWNINSATNSNNNNKSNSYAVRPVTALGTDIKESWLTAYLTCCRHKSKSSQCSLYRPNFELDLWTLMDEVYTQTYMPGTSDCFVVFYPRPREVFAAAFRDRIVQQWVAARLDPMFELEYIQSGDITYNCRKGYGTDRAVEDLVRDMEEVTQGYNTIAYVATMDIQGFFMSVRKDIMADMVCRKVGESYTQGDKDTVLYLVRTITMHCPQHDCVRKSSMKAWEKVAAEKSLFGQPSNRGMPIGNVTSHTETNYYMNGFCRWLHDLCMANGARVRMFADDIAIVSPSKEFILEARKLMQAYLSDNLCLTLHPRKFYLQEARKGVRWLGRWIKPRRMYVCNRTVTNFIRSVRSLDDACYAYTHGALSRRTLSSLLSTTNSYLGIMSHVRSRKIRMRALGNSMWLWDVCCVRNIGNKSTIRFRVLKV